MMFLVGATLLLAAVEKHFKVDPKTGNEIGNTPIGRPPTAAQRAKSTEHTPPRKGAVYTKHFWICGGQSPGMTFSGGCPSGSTGSFCKCYAWD